MIDEKNFSRKIMTTADNPDERGLRELQRIVENMRRKIRPTRKNNQATDADDEAQRNPK